MKTIVSAFDRSNVTFQRYVALVLTSINHVLLQVKVWFQNRRTKFKRVKAEEDMTRTFPKNRNVAKGQLTGVSDTHNYASSSEESDIDV